MSRPVHRTPVVRCAATTTLAWSTAHRNAVIDLVLAAFPTATVHFSEATRSTADPRAAQGDALPLQRSRSRLHNMRRSIKGQAPAMSSTLCALPDYYSVAQDSVVAACGAGGGDAADATGSLLLWQALHNRYGPTWQPSSCYDLAPPHCPWRCYPDTASHDAGHGGQSSVRLVPSWVPHAVVAVGGTEAIDVRRVLAPRLIDNVPTLDELPLTPATTCDAARSRLSKARSPLVSHRTRLPKYLQDGMYDTRLTLQRKGCGVRGGNLVELSVPVVSTGDDDGCRRGELARIRTFVSFADPDTTLHDLCVERDAVRRMFLRGAFGYSLSLLQQALPPPLVAAVRTLREWQSTCETQLQSSQTQSDKPHATAACSSAFFVSLVAHVLTGDLHMVHRSLTDHLNCAQDAAHMADCALRHTWLSEEVEQQALASFACLVEDALRGRVAENMVSSSSSCLPAAQNEAELRVVSHVLALASVRALRTAATNVARRTRYSANFFLPGETFEHCDDVTRLLEHCPHMPLP